jgi:protein TonB
MAGPSLAIRFAASGMSSYRATDRPFDRGRIFSAIAVIAVHLAIGLALLHGLGVELPHAVATSLASFDVLPPPPPLQRIAPQRRASPRKEGAASPPNLRAKATEVVAPPLILPPILPPPVVAAPVAGIGADPSAGAAPIRGPGTGSGGIGNGTGSGGAGNGDGGGGGSPLRLKSGRIKDSDYPREALRAGASGTVGLLFTVGVTGRVTQCTVTRSSGNADLDSTTCRLIQERFRYKPTTDASGRAIPDEVEGEHVWTLYRREAPDDDPR